jgi:predicted nucleotide-binding protein (sugar kinase/HSP70/actin superfamily)
MLIDQPGQFHYTANQSDNERGVEKPGLLRFLWGLLGFLERQVLNHPNKTSRLFVDEESYMLRIGIPRALHFYQYYPLWRTFFEALETELVVSPPTDRSMLSQGAKLVADVTCMPVKVYAGHVTWLRDQGKVDVIFVPAMRSIERGALQCSKFMGLPDIIHATVPNCPPLLEVDIDAHRYKITMDDAFQRLGVQMTHNSAKVRQAWKAARRMDEAFQRLLTEEKLTYLEAFGRLYPGEWPEVAPSASASSPILRGSGLTVGTNGLTVGDDGLTVGVVGHPYCIHDDYVSHNVITRLRQLGVRVLTSEMVPTADARQGIEQTTGQTRWFYENWMSGAGGHFFQRPDVQGVISVLAFTCGPDSAMVETLSRRAHALQRPFMSLVLDEHGSATGMITRLEAFVDMLSRQKTAHPETAVEMVTKEKITPPAVLHAIHQRVLGFPRMGTSAIALKSLFTGIGMQVELGPTLSNRTVSLGARHSPEFICTPYKYILGNMVEMVESGANTLLYMDGAELCRNSCYTQLLTDALRDMGHKVQLVSTGAFEKGGLFALPKFLSQFMDDFSWPLVLRQIYLAVAKMGVLDEIERRLQFLRPRQVTPGSADKVWDEAAQRIEEASNRGQLQAAQRDMLQKMALVEIDPSKQPVRIATTGEYYALLEPFYNQSVERVLGDLGAEVHRTIMLGDWVKTSMILDALGLHHSEVEAAAKPYLRWNIGGEGLLTVGQAVQHAKKGFDGLVELLPFTCLPEITALNILPKISREMNFPIISFILDEQTGQAGMRTRLEAFVDLLNRRREMQAAA